MAFEFLNDLLSQIPRELIPRISSRKDGNDYSNITINLSKLLGEPAQPQGPMNITPNVSAAPMGAKTSESMSGYVPGDIGDPAAADLDPTQKAFLNATSTGESRGRYDVRFTPAGGMRFTDFSKHPGIMEPGPEGPSSAAGRYQFTKSTWDSLGGGPFDPVTQDIRGVQLAERDYRKITGRDLWSDLKEKGFTPEVAKALSSTWTSFRSPEVVRQAQKVFEKSVEKYGGTKVAGDVVPMGMVPRGTAGPTNKSADYGWGNKTEPGVTGIGPSNMMKWLDRAGERYRGQKPTGVGPNAEPGGGNLPPLTDATPEQHDNFIKLVQDSPVRDQIAEILKDRWALNPQTWMREQDALAWPKELETYFQKTYKGDKNHKLLNEAGINRLKRYMLDRLGVDTKDLFDRYDDTATPSERRRQGSIFETLKKLENEFIHEQNLDGLLRTETLAPKKKQSI